MAFRRFGTFRTPHGWLGTDGDGRIFQRGLKRDEPDNNVVVPDKPLQAYVSGNTIKITLGTISNKIPKIGNTLISDESSSLSFPEDGQYFILLNCPAVNYGNVTFPSDNPVIEISDTIPSDTNTSARLILAYLSVVTEDGVQSATIQNVLSGSLWGERLKVSNSVATYYFNAI
jgi:hypothetical protein